MDPNQQQQILGAIAVSSLHLPQFTPQDRQGAFTILQDFKKYAARVPVSIQWLHEPQHVFQQHDITTAVKLLALEILGGFLQKGYSAVSEQDRLALRQAVLRAAFLAATMPANPQQVQERRILAKKLAVILEGLVIRDFPQRWTTFANDVFTPVSAGGLWFQEPGAAAVSEATGVKICLECLKLVAEDCTDSDFNAKVSTTRRNDVLIGLNEISQQTLPLFFQLLEHYPVLQQSKATLHQMHGFLASSNRTLAQMTTDEATLYQQELTRRKDCGVLIADTLSTVEKFCGSMPVQWMLGAHDFVAAMMHLLREPDCAIQIKAIDSLEQLCLRGKMEFSQWMRLIAELPIAVQEANHAFSAELEQQEAARVVKGDTGKRPDPLALQLEFHRGVSRLLANVLSSHLAHITSNKKLASGEGADKLHAFLRLLVEILHHPSGRICTEQLNMWVALLRDPQIVKRRLLQPYIQEVLTCYMDKMVRVRWDDIEEQTHPQTELLEASFDDEDEYDVWMADLRSRASLLFKFIGNTEPQIAASVLDTRVKSLLTTYGNGAPINFVEPSNNQLTPKSEAVMQFEGLYQPLDNVLGGIPAWALESDNKSSSNGKEQYEIRQRAEIRVQTRGALSELTQALVSWNPSYLWLKFRRASLLDPLKYYWKYDPSTLLQGVDSLLRYLGAPDEWQGNTGCGGVDKLSGESVGLKKKSGVTLVSVSKKVPHHLVPWLSQLSDATKSLLSSEGIVPMNQMHLYEFLSCVATAVEDPVARANFIGTVLSNSVETLLSPEVQQSMSSVPALLSFFGVTQAAEHPESVTDPTNVKTITANYNRVFSALNRLLSVGKRCSEAAQKQILARGFPAGSTSQGFNGSETQNFPDEGPMSIQDLAVYDPFAPLWPKILPSVLQIYESAVGMWRPEHQAVLLRNRYQRYAYAISDDEAYLSQTHGSKSGGVFGQDGTAGSVVAGADRRDVNIVPKWSGWFNELRNTCFQMFGLLATGRVLYAPELASMYPRLVAVMVDPVTLKSMEHRFVTQFLKHVVELVLVSCPSTMYPTHLEPLMGPIFEHLRIRLEKSWMPILGTASPNGPLTEATKALTSSDCEKAALLASRGDDAWFSYCYAHSGLFVGDLDSVTAEAAVEKHRVELSRTFSDVLQVALALKGDWALVLANLAKEEHALKRGDPSTLTSGPRNRLLHHEQGEVNADGTPKTQHQSGLDARKMLRINGLCHFLLLENEGIAGSLTLSVIQCLSFPDAYTCRRITRICHRIIETVASSPPYTQLLGQQMFTQAVKNIATEPRWMVGIEWDMINVVRDLYCRLVLGQTLQPGGLGAGMQQPTMGMTINQYDQAKAADRPLLGGGIAVLASDVPRQILLSLPGITRETVEELERNMKRKRSAKDQKDVIRDLLRVAADNLKELNPSTDTGANGIFDRAVEEESLLHSKTPHNVVPDLPEKLVTRSQVAKAAYKKNQQQPEGLAAFSL